MRALPLVLLLAPALLASACRRGPSARETAASSATSPPAASPPSPPAASLAASPAASPAASLAASAPAASLASSRPAAPSASAPPTEAERATLTKYLDAIGRARKLTLLQQYPEAIKAFDEALRQMPMDARALAERGFARLQADDIDGAEQDFYATLAHTPDPAVLSATTYNLALVADRRGNGAQAADLRESARKNRVPEPPSNRCLASIRRGQAISVEGEALKLQSLRQVRTELNKFATRYATPFTPALPTTDEEANLLKDMLGGGPGPWFLVNGEHEHILFGEPLHYLLRLDVAPSRSFRCGSTTRRQITMTGYPMASSQVFDAGMGLSCPKGKDVTAEQMAQDCRIGCLGPAYVQQDYVVFDPANGDALLGFSTTLGVEGDRDPINPISLVVRDKGVQLLGNGCNAFVPFRP